ncbi:hypothetical protein QYF36_003237 [Acer negundo]|nr:hypothetical protein QYF36_003237 [Acer negundo]
MEAEESATENERENYIIHFLIKTITRSDFQLKIFSYISKEKEKENRQHKNLILFSTKFTALKKVVLKKLFGLQSIDIAWMVMKAIAIKSFRRLNSRYLKILKPSTHSDMSVGPVDVALHIITAAPSSPIFYGLIRNEEQKIIFSFIIFWLSSEFLLIFFVPQVHAYGSVPLQTYLPDGDIDLTAFSKNQDLKWYDILKEVLENERERENAEFCLKDVEIIHAKVQIVKCIVENIAVDISFNQLGGLCALCFLEEVDNLINKNHLFKRSILLIKAWCYYERHILGAQHSFISTYALETLVLYIFHAFDNSLAGPLEVLYRFLEFFSKFDWDNFYVSLWGPVPRSSIPDMAAAVPPRRDGQELLLSKSVYECIAAYTVLPLGQGNLNFKPKRFNIMDPLLRNNNLGISVSEVSGIAVPPPVLHDQDPNLGYVYPVIALLHDPSLIYGHPAEQLGYGYPAEHFSGVDVASHDEDPSSVHDHRVHDSEFPSPD